jgi:hypothetical protein
MNQFYNDLKTFIKKHWETILLMIMIVIIMLTSIWTDIKQGIMDGWMNK